MKQPMKPAARLMALEILRQSLDQGQDLQAAVDAVLRAQPQSPDKALATELACGFLRLRGRLDFLLDHALNAPDKTSPGLRRILGVAAYELLFLRVPEYATLDWAVSLVRKRFGQPMSRVTNAVLHRLLRLGQAVHFPEFYQSHAPDQTRFMAAWYSCPVWLVRHWLTAYGPEASTYFLQASLLNPPLGIRVNRQHPEAVAMCETVTTLAKDHDGYGFALDTWPPILSAALEKGLISRQSLAAQRIMTALDPESWPEPILDACAGRGGKTFFLAETGKTVWASDTNTFRLRGLRTESQRLRIPVPMFQAQAQRPSPLRHAPRTILLDAPCSGLGVLARRPDSKWKRKPTDCAQLAELQTHILDHAAKALPTGGTLVYITCTLNPAENEHQLACFLRTHPDFSLIREEPARPDCNLYEFFYGATLRKA